MPHFLYKCDLLLGTTFRKISNENKGIKISNSEIKCFQIWEK